MEHETVYIYSLSDPYTGIAKYIGKTHDLKQRYKRHVHTKNGRNTKVSKWIIGLRKNGEKPTLSLLRVSTAEKGRYYEQYYIDNHSNLLNMTKGGEGCYSFRMEESAKLKMRGSRESVSGKNNPAFGLYGDRHPAYGNVHSEETKRKISRKGKLNHMYGKILSEETRQKIRKTTGNKIVLNGTEYDSQRHACSLLNIPRTSLRNAMARNKKFFEYNGEKICIN